MPEPSQANVERVLQVTLGAQQALLSPDPTYIAELRAGPFDRVELRPPTPGNRAALLLLRVRQGSQLPWSAFRARLLEAGASPVPSDPRDPNPTRSYRTRHGSGYVIEHDFDMRTDQLVMISLRRGRDDS